MVMVLWQTLSLRRHQGYQEVVLRLNCKPKVKVYIHAHIPTYPHAHMPTCPHAIRVALEGLLVRQAWTSIWNTHFGVFMLFELVND